VALSFVKDEAKPRRGAARQGRALDQAQSHSKLAAMDLRRGLLRAATAGGRMDIHKPKPWHGSRELAKEIATIVVGVLIALAAEQAVDWLRWRYEIGEARKALGREITYNVKALKIMDQQSACVTARAEALAAWASGTGPRPAGPVRMPLLYSLQTSTWDVSNASQAIAHFPLDLKLSYATLFSRFGNEREAITDERAAWAQIIAVANQPKPDTEELRRVREAVGLAEVWEGRRISNSRNMIRLGTPLSMDGPGPLPASAYSGYLTPCIEIPKEEPKPSR